MGNFKEELYNSKIQVIQITSNGKVVESDNTIFPLKPNDELSDTHPFFEGIAPLFAENSKKIHFPCVNLSIDSKDIIADVDLVNKDDKVFVLVFDFTDHYVESHPLVQEKNEASILKNKLSFEREILLAKEELKNQFLSYINHEIRNPLNNLMGFMDILDDTKLNYEQKETVNVMSKIGNHMKVLLDDLVDISRIEEGVTEIKSVPFSLSQVVNSLIKNFQLKFSKSNIKLIHQFSKDVPIRVIGDPTRLNQILFNLLNTAFKNTSEGVISIDVDLKEMKENKVALVRIVISDTGKGIPEANMPYVFDSYHQLEFNELKPIGEGLGLKIVKDLVNLLDGTVQVSSTEGEGTSYELILPFIEREKKAPVKKTVPKGTGIVMSKRILIVENEKISQMLLFKTFLDNKEGYIVDFAKDGGHALEIIQKRKYDLVLMKMNLPDMNGLDLIQKIRKTNHVPILVVSGSSMKNERAETLNEGASAFLPKPYTKKELYSTIDEVLNS